MIIDYGRPQDTFRFFGYIRPAMILIIILTLFIFRNLRLVTQKIFSIRLIWCFILILAIQIPFARNNRYAYNTMNTMLIAMPFILSCYAVITSTNRFKRIILIAVCLMAYQAQHAITHGGHGSGNVFLDENDLALFINTWLPFCLALFLSEKGFWKKTLFGIFMVLGLAADVVSFSRGGFMGLIAMVAVFWIFSPKKLLTLGILILGAVLVIIVSSLASSGKISHQKNRSFWGEMATSKNAQSGTAKERVESWKAGWRMFLANPLGIGGNNFQVRFPEYQDNEYFRRGMWGRVAHSLWFTLIPETGIFGIIVYLLLLFANIKAIFKLRKYAKILPEEDAKFLKNISVAFLASFAGFFASATFLAVLYYPHYWYLTGLLVAITLISTNKIETGTDKKELNVVQEA
ncbi:MAG: O-antigen ligase family protein [Candidatus Pacebacteria bacterium]|nr:O-antigen ligase family protein [Candidatus Paceibacterota bacterium]